MEPRSKKLKGAERGEGKCSSHVDGKLARSISKIKDIQRKLKNIDVEEDNKVLEILQEYSDIRKEIYTRRNEVLLPIKKFWTTLFICDPVLIEFLNEEDRKILRYLVALDVEEHPKQGYSISLIFSPNPYFENKKLTKTYSFPDEETAVITGAEIKWKEGLHNANKSAHEAGKGLEDLSFFMWLSNTQQIPASAAAQDKIASTIRTRLWPDPVKYILDDKSLHGEGDEQNVDEQGGKHDDEIENKEAAGEGGDTGMDDETDAEGGTIVDEFEEGDEEVEEYYGSEEHEEEEEIWEFEEGWDSEERAEMRSKRGK